MTLQRVMLRLLWCLILTAAALSRPPFNGSAAGGVTFKPSFSRGNTELKLRGVATFRYLVVIKAYTGALYLPEDIRSEDILTNVPKRLVLEYFHAIKADDFYKTTRAFIEKNTAPKTFEMLQEQLEKLRRTYRDVRPNDRYALTYWPGYGTELSLNGKLLGTFKGEAFARAMFSIWLGKHPIDKTFRKRISGRE